MKGSVVSFDLLCRKLEYPFADLVDGPLPETVYDDEEASYDSEGNNNFSR